MAIDERMEVITGISVHKQACKLDNEKERMKDAFIVWWWA